MKPSDFREIRYGYLKQLSRKRLFLEQRLSDSYAFIDDVKEYQRFPHSLTNLVEINSGRSPLMALFTSKRRENRYTEGHNLLKDKNIVPVFSAISSNYDKNP
jgi:hypothetical protein